jgi:sugar lactone lactonase YvrE
MPRKDHSQANFAQVAPVLDEAINQLAPEEQSAIVLRFFEQLDFSSVGEALGSTEEAARKRVNRALDKLHALLTARGVTLSAAALGAALADRAVQAAPAGLVGNLAKSALTSAAAGHGSTLTVLKGLTASKVSLGVAGAMVLAGAAWLSWRQWWPWWPPKPPPLALNGTWTRLDKPQPIGHIQPEWVFAVSPDGQLYVGDSEENGRIQKRDHDGRWSLVASVRASPGSLEKPPLALACDDSGSLYVAEPVGIRKRDRNGHWTSLATKGQELGEVVYPSALVLDGAGNLYVTDEGRRVGGQNRILLRKPDGHWARLAGQVRDVGELSDTRLGDVATDAQGNLYVADSGGNRIQKRDATGRWSVVDVDPLKVGAPLWPAGIAVDASGALYVVECRGPGDRLLKRDVGGQWSVLATFGRELGQIDESQHLGIDSTGALYVADRFPPRLEKRDPNGTWTVVCAPSAEPGIFSGIITQLTVDAQGSLYVMDWGRQQVQKRDPKGRWTVLFDPAIEPGEFGHPSCFAVDQQHNLYVADYRRGRVMMRDFHGKWGACMPPGLGIGETQRPNYLSVDASDNLYVVDGDHCRLQKRDHRGRWTVLAEVDPARDMLDEVAAAPDGNVYVAFHQSALRRLDAKGRWATVAASGGRIATDSFGRLYVADGRKLKVRDGDGKWYELPAPRSAEDAPLSPWRPRGVAVDRDGIVYLAADYPPGVFRWTPQPQRKAE